MNLFCPKCQNIMTRYERAGVVVDQWTEGGGRFLGRGELERLASAEREWHTDSAHYRDRRLDSAHYRDRHLDRSYGRPYEGRRHDGGNRADHAEHAERPRRRRRGSFFEEPFDFD